MNCSTNWMNFPQSPSINLYTAYLIFVWQSSVFVLYDLALHFCEYEGNSVQNLVRVIIFRFIEAYLWRRLFHHWLLWLSIYDTFILTLNSLLISANANLIKGLGYIFTYWMHSYLWHVLWQVQGASSYVAQNLRIDRILCVDYMVHYSRCPGSLPPLQETSFSLLLWRQVAQTPLH